MEAQHLLQIIIVIFSHSKELARLFIQTLWKVTGGHAHRLLKCIQYAWDTVFYMQKELSHKKVSYHTVSNRFKYNFVYKTVLHLFHLSFEIIYLHIANATIITNELKYFNSTKWRNMYKVHDCRTPSTMKTKLTKGTCTVIPTFILISRNSE